ncbi:hypothetical protein KVT40_003448 [Elsinoe batatas]|uniref:Uncharacterized protein n=1 Tax=Elsinoe batatas TaxID=2601811 RepID=A0A8K0L7K2_9PEZI|nr:hypothetical protein KVT40_003448 [Elsinoe batatas]
MAVSTSYWSVSCPFPQFRRGDSRRAFRSRIQWLTPSSYQIQTGLPRGYPHLSRHQPSYQWRGPFRLSSPEQTPRLGV